MNIVAGIFFRAYANNMKGMKTSVAGNIVDNSDFI